MLTKLQVIFCVLIGLALVVFFVAIVTNVNVPKVPNWVAIVVWSTFGLMIASCLGVVVTLILENREPKPRKEVVEELVEEHVDEMGEMAMVGATSELEAGEGIADMHDGGVAEHPDHAEHAEHAEFSETETAVDESAHVEEELEPHFDDAMHETAHEESHEPAHEAGHETGHEPAHDPTAETHDHLEELTDFDLDFKEE